MKNSAVIYCRQSSGDDDYSESVEVQKAHCLKLAKQHKITVIGEYSDLNASGKLYPTGFEELAAKDICYQNWLKSVTTRKQFRSGLGEVFKLLSDIDYIIVDDYTRLARPLTGSFLDAIITQSLAAYNVKVLTVKTGEIDLTAFNDSLITALQSRINDNQLAIQRKKSIDGLRRLKDSGISQNGIASVFGFKSTGRKHEIELVENEVEVIKFIYKSFLSGVGITEIAKQLNENFKEVFKDTLADRHLITKILLRPLYCGYMYNSNGELIESKQIGSKAFISFDDWHKIKEIFEVRKVIKPRAKENWAPCSGFVFCGKCGARMILRGGTSKTAYYGCDSHLKLRKDLCRGNLASSITKEAGLGLVEAIAPLLVVGVQEKLKELALKSTFQNDLKEVKVQLSNVVEKEKRLTELYLKGLIEDSIFENSLTDLKTAKTDLKAKMISLKEKMDNEEDEERVRKLYRKVVNGHISHGEYEELFRMCIKKITVTLEKVTVNTILGVVEIPRQHIGRYTLLPHFSFASVNEGKLKLYYYYGKKRDIANVYAKSKVLATLGNLEVVYLY